MTDYEVHPVADLFPMLGEEELGELAADIAERGLLHPVALDSDGRVLDGRNRLAACERAGIEPSFTTYDGDDPGGYALAVNLQRRNLTKGQQAMVAAKARLVSKQDIRSVAKQSGLNAGRVGQAATVAEHAPDMVDAVIAGALGLDAAYEEARKRKTAADSVEAQLARLRAEDPELADRVVEGDLTLPGAWAERRAREAQRESERRVGIANLRSVLTYLVSTSIEPHRLAEHDYADVLDEFKRDDLAYAAATMTAIVALKEGT
jgi:hypothetical protein